MLNNRYKLFSELSGVEFKENAFITELKENISKPFQTIVDHAIKQTHPHADEQLWYHLTFSLPESRVNIQNVISLYEAKWQQEALTGREYFVLGNCYTAFKENHIAALTCFQKAEALGDVGALNNLGLMYLDGLGVAVNKDKAKDYLERAIQKGNLLAKLNLSHCYREEGDVNKADEYLLESADIDDCSNAMRYRATYLEREAKKNENQLALSYTIEKWLLAKAYLEKSAAKGDIYSLYKLAKMHIERDGMSPEIDKKYSTPFLLFLLPYRSFISDDLEYASLLTKVLPSSVIINVFETLIRIDHNQDIYKNLAKLYENGGNDLSIQPNQAAKYYVKAWEYKKIDDSILQTNLHRLLNLSMKYEPGEVIFYLGLIFHPDLIIKNKKSKEALNIKFQELFNHKMAGREHLLDRLIEDNLKYIKEEMYKKNKYFKKSVDKLKTRDALIAKYLTKNTASMVSLYLLGDDGCQAKLKFFDPSKARDNKMVLTGRCVIS